MKKSIGTKRNGRRIKSHLFNTDIYIKDEGDDFSTVVFQTPESQRVADNHLHGYETATGKINILNDELHKVLAWAVSHNLTIDSEVPLTIPEYGSQ